MALIEYDFPSANGRDTIHSWIYEPVVAARAIVQIIHGLGEHSRRYLRLISQLLDAGFVVVAEDHAGHGKTAMDSGIWGDAGDHADAVVVDDAATLLAHARQLHPDLPVIVFGHSWGSMIARVLAGREPVDALALCGIAAQMHGIERVLDRVALAAADPMAPSDQFAAGVFDGFTSRYGADAGPTSWVAKDENVVRDHGIDPFNNFGVSQTVRFMQGFVTLYDRANSEQFYASLPESVPVLILAGDADPVTNYGEGAYHVANRLVETGHADVRCRVYTGFRHEVHNEPEIRDEVAAEIITFAERAIARG